MKIEQAKELAEKALAQLAENLEQGHSDELKKYLAAMAKFPRYSLNNLVLILAQRPDTARVAGYQTWRQLGRQVNRSAKGILILTPIVRRKAENNGREEVSGDNGSFVKLLGFRGVHVFAEEDTSGQPIPRLSRCSGDPSAFAERPRQSAPVGASGVLVHGGFSERGTYGLALQMRRAAVSIPANIAEGFRRRGKADKARYMNVAEASLEESRYYLILAQDLEYGDTSNLISSLEEVSRLLNAYASAIRASDS
jgi:four helix bundle protein